MIPLIPLISLRNCFVLICLVLVLTACGSADATPTAVEVIQETAEPYPALPAGPTDPSTGYPIQPPSPAPVDVYPPPSPEITIEAVYPGPTEPPEGILLALNKPVNPDDRTVSGVGVPGLMVFILNVTDMGELLGSGTIDEDGNFSIQVSELEEGIQIGLAADLANSGLTNDDIIPGDGEFSVPQVGYFFDTVVVREN